MWILYTQIAAVLDSFRNTFSKDVVKRAKSSVVVSWGWITFALLVYIPIIIFSDIPKIQSTFWIILAVRTVFDFLGLLFYSEAIKHSDLSIVIPINTFLPVFTLFSSFFINKEHPSFISVVGIFIVIIGTFLLVTIKNKKFSFSIKSFINEKGVYLMLLSAVFFGTNASLHKATYNYLDGSSKFIEAAFSLGIGYIILSLSLLILFLIVGREDLNFIKKKTNTLKLIVLGVCGGGATLLNIYAIGLTYTAFASVLFRSSIIFSTIFGAIFFKEKIKDRIIPILIMITGAVIVVLFK